MEGIIQFFENLTKVYVHQTREWGEIITGFETRNKYKVLDEQGQSIGFIAEQRTGLFGTLLRMMLRSHRPMTIKVWNQARSELLDIERPFYWFFSTMHVVSQGRNIGRVEKRFGIIYKKYDLIDKAGNIFARVRAPIWRLWTFPIFDSREQAVGEVSKKWGGMMKEIFTDEDKFFVDLSKFTPVQKAIVFATAISIDLDYFEENQSNNDGVI